MTQDRGPELLTYGETSSSLETVPIHNKNLQGRKDFLRRSSRRADVVAILIIVAIWVVLAVLVNPHGEFPLNDDWAYAHAVKTLLEEAAFKPHWFGAMNLFTQVYWGALFCLPFGFSFTALRISTLVLGLAGIIALYGLFREAGADRNTSLFGSLLLGLNSLYVSLSFTFMTDVPFLAFSLVSLYLLVRAMRSNSRVGMAVGIVFACVALLIRQAGIALFVALGFAYLLNWGFRKRHVFIAASFMLLGFAVQSFFQEWLKITRRLSPAYGSQIHAVVDASYFQWNIALLGVHSLVIVSTYLGLFLVPFFLYLGLGKIRYLFHRWPMTLAAIGFAVSALYVLRNRRMPLLPDVLYNLGLGAVTTYDTSALRLHHFPSAGKSFWTLLTFLGLVGAVFLFQVSLAAAAELFHLRMVEAKRKGILGILFATILVYLAPITVLIFLDRCYDRYLLFLLPLFSVVCFLMTAKIGPAHARSRLVPLAVAGLVLYGAFAVAGTHDYLSLNRVRWQALNRLMQDGHVAPDRIDGGFEFNGWYSQNPQEQLVGRRDADFLITVGSVAGCTELNRYHFTRWLPPGNGVILVLKSPFSKKEFSGACSTGRGESSRDSKAQSCVIVPRPIT